MSPHVGGPARRKSETTGAGGSGHEGRRRRGQASASWKVAGPLFNLFLEVHFLSGHFQASAEQFEDRLKGLLDRADQTDADQHQGGGGDEHQDGGDEHQGDGVGAERPARKRRKLLEVGEYNQAYDEVIFLYIFCPLFFYN